MTLIDLLVDSLFILPHILALACPVLCFPSSWCTRLCCGSPGRFSSRVGMQFNCSILDCSCLMYFFMLQRSEVRWRATLTGACRRQVYQDYNRTWMGPAVSPCVKNGNMYPGTWIHLHGNALLLPHPLLPKQSQILWETHTYTIIVQTVVRAFLASDLNSSCQR